MQRTVFINPVEPGQFSGRAPIGFDCPIDIRYRTFDDEVWTSDLVASLVITGRTSTRSLSYVVPATDVVNGKAAVTIPGTDLQDPNGYVMTLVGSLNGRRQVLANGVLLLSEMGIPDIDAVDIVDTIDIVLNYDETCELDITLWQDSASGTPYDLTAHSTSVQASVYDAKGGAVLVPFTVTVLDVNKVRISLTIAQVNALPEACWWSLVAGLPEGSTTLCEGSVDVTGAITPPLVTTVINYDYQKPDNADPVSGQIIHGNWTQSVLKISKVSSDAVDVSPTLVLIRAGDQIIAGLTTWSVQRIFDATGWYEFTVLPIQQAAVTGVTAITFQRPTI